MNGLLLYAKRKGDKVPKFFVNPSQVGENHIEIIGQDVKHIKDVLRLDHDAEIIICNGQGIDYKCIINKIDKETITAQIINKELSKSEPKTKITLFQSLIKGDKFEWVIQKAVEIGVSEIVPIITTHCVVKVDFKKLDGKLQRWNKIAESAAKQSGRGAIPQVVSPIKFEDAIRLCNQMDLACIPYEKEHGLSLRAYIADNLGNTLGVLIGPEGGFSEEEVLLAQKNKVKPITLGNRILRSETASIVTLANILYEMGEMENGKSHVLSGR